MHVRDFRDVEPFYTSHGEIVRELAGLSAGGLQQHSVAHITIQPGKSSLKHYHPIVEESYYILYGSGIMIIDGETRHVSAGQVIGIAPRQVHQIFNEGAEDLVMLVTCTPPWTPDCSIFVE